MQGMLSDAEAELDHLIVLEDLDRRAASGAGARFEAALTDALRAGFEEPLAALFLQRVLYKINRLKLFWFDDLGAYVNERSAFLSRVRDTVEDRWQTWELSQLDITAIRAEDVIEGLRERTRVDVDPSPGALADYFRHQMTLAGYRRFLEIGSLDGLVEASQLSRMLGGAANPVQAMLTRIFIEEYGAGKLAKKHSTFFVAMLEELGMDSRPEAYLDKVPWEVLATINQSFLLSERRTYYLRYAGGLTYFEMSAPAAFRHIQAAAQRLGLSETAIGYWTLHIREDERHGPWMLDEVAIPLARMYPRDGSELLIGYDQQRAISQRAGQAILREAIGADRAAPSP